jgi:hypothetical protein
VKPPNAGLQLRRAISIQAEGKKLLEKHAIAPSAARLCWASLGAIGTIGYALWQTTNTSPIFFAGILIYFHDTTIQLILAILLRPGYPKHFACFSIHTVMLESDDLPKTPSTVKVSPPRTSQLNPADSARTIQAILLLLLDVHDPLHTFPKHSTDAQRWPSAAARDQHLS